MYEMTEYFLQHILWKMPIRICHNIIVRDIIFKYFLLRSGGVRDKPDGNVYLVP